jgi:hypothetical protein
MTQSVQVKFDCLPLRSVTRLDIPLDASPKYRAFCERVKAAIEMHGTYNAYYLYNASCIYHLTNRDDLGMLEFRFEGTLFTDEKDLRSERANLQVELVRETCEWLTEPIVAWFRETVTRTVLVEFDRYIEAGDLEKARLRLEKIQSASDEQGGYMGMYL